MDPRREASLRESVGLCAGLRFGDASALLILIVEWWSCVPGGVAEPDREESENAEDARKSGLGGFGAPEYPGWPYAGITSGSAINNKECARADRVGRAARRGCGE